MTYHMHNAGGSAFNLEAAGTIAVTKIKVSKNSDLMIMSFPGGDSSTAFADDVDGVVRKMSVEGIVTDTAANINTFIVALEAYVDGAQMDDATRHVFHSDAGSGADYTVCVDAIEWEMNAEDPSELLLKWRIDMTETAT